MKILASMIGLAITAAATAQAPVHPPVQQPPAPVVEKQHKQGDHGQKAPKLEKNFKIDVSTEVNIFKFSNASIVEVDNEFTYELSDKWTVGFSLPIFNDGDVTRSETGLGDIDFSVAYDLYDGDWKFLNSSKTWVDLTAGLGLPLDGEYSSNDITFNLGGVVGAKWDALSVSYTANYKFVDEYTFVAPLGGFVYSDVYSGVLSAEYQLEKNLSVALNLSQFSATDNTVVLLGPAVKYEFSKACVLTAEIGVPVVDDLATEDLDVAMSAGLSFKF